MMARAANGGQSTETQDMVDVLEYTFWLGSPLRRPPRAASWSRSLSAGLAIMARAQGQGLPTTLCLHCDRTVPSEVTARSARESVLSRSPESHAAHCTLEQGEGRRRGVPIVD